MRKAICAVLFLSILCIGSSAKAGVDIDLHGLSNAQRAELVMKAEEMKRQAPQSSSVVEQVTDQLTTENAGKMIEVGKNLGLALAAVAKEVGVSADEFLKSTTGKISVVVIIWKLMGKDIIAIVGGSVAWIVLSSIIIWSFKFFHMKKKVKTKDQSVQYIQRYEFKTSDARSGSAVGHVAAFAAVTVICMFIVF